MEEGAKENLRKAVQDARERQLECDRFKRERDALADERKQLRNERDALLEEKMSFITELEGTKGQAEKWRVSVCPPIRMSCL